MYTGPFGLPWATFLAGVFVLACPVFALLAYMLPAFDRFFSEE